jgi:prepilin-type N-terminal cleavage/methylation domain-containing protein
MRRGYTLIEISIALTLLALLLLIAYPVTDRWRDRWAVRRASLEVAAFYHTARHAALLRATRVAVSFAPDTLRAVYEGLTDSAFISRTGPAEYGVSLTASTPLIRIGPNGVGYGAANSKVVLSRGMAAESLTTSRLGRLRRWP